MSSEQAIYVRHNAEIAHRLSQLPGKCQRIHGHSLQIELTLFGEVNDLGILQGYDFGSVKKAFREYIDTWFDHHLLMNKDDQLLRAAEMHDFQLADIYPGVQTFEADPTIENIARWIGTWAHTQFQCSCEVRVQETNTNGAHWSS